MDNTVAIVGAGMAGLGTAYSLRKHGIPSTLFEPSQKAGGRMTTETIGDFHVDTGASFVVRSFGAVAPLVREIGMGDQMQVLARNAVSLYRDGRFHTISISNPATAIPFAGLSWKAKFSALGTVPDLARNYFRVNNFLDAYRGITLDDGESAYDWLVRRSSRELAEYLGDPVCQALCAYGLRDMSKLNFMCYSMSVLGMKLYSFRDGMGSVPARLAQDMDVRYHSRVTRVEQKHERVEVTWEQGGQRETRDFAAAVVATWGDIVPQLVTGLTPMEIAIFNGTSYSTTTPVILTTDLPIENPFYGVYIAPGESQVLASFGIEDAKGNLNVPQGKGCLFCMTREDFVRGFSGTDEELGSIVAREAEKFFPQIRGRVTGVHVFRWPRAIEKMPPGRFSLLQGLKAQWPRERRIFVAGAYLVAPCTDGAFHSGRLAAAQVAARLK